MSIKETNRASTPSASAAAAAAETVALSALAWVLADEGRALRLLDLTGLTPDQLRGGLNDPAVLGATLRFLESHEPDLLACAAAIGAGAAELVQARRVLEEEL
jgi:hypothetical protein